MNIINLSPEQLRQAADIQERIRSLQTELTSLLGAQPAPVSVPTTPRTSPLSTSTNAGVGRKRKFSAQAIANIRAGAQKRWAQYRSTTGTAPAPKKRGHISAAGRRALAAAVKARWAAAKAAGKSAL